MKGKKGYVSLEIVIVMGFIIVLAISLLILNFQHSQTVKEYAKTIKTSVEIKNKEDFLYEFKEYLENQGVEKYNYNFNDLGTFNKNIANKIYSIKYNMEENIFEMQILNNLNNIENNVEKYIYNYQIEENEIFFLKVTK